jgi:hypothetical protein
MTALRFDGTTSEREANPTRGRAGRVTGRAQPGSVMSSKGSQELGDRSALIFCVKRSASRAAR